MYTSALSFVLELNYFKLKDYGIPYSYSPVIAANENRLPDMKEVYKRFLQATKEGFLYAAQNAKKAVNILAPHVPEADQNIDLLKSQEYSAQHYGDVDNWGRMNEDRVELFVNWLSEHHLEPHRLKVQDLISNQLLAQ